MVFSKLETEKTTGDGKGIIFIGYTTSTDMLTLSQTTSR
jgi:hypothetical protein